MINPIVKTIELNDGRTITLETGKLAKQADGAVMLRMLLFPCQLLCGKLLKGCGQNISVPPLEKHKVARRAFRRVLFQCKVNAVFLCRTLKGFDIAVSDFDAAYACVLLHKLF